MLDVRCSAFDVFPVSGRELRILIGKFLALGNSYWLTRFVILRLLGFVYAIAFLVAANQIVPLVGKHGLTPASYFLDVVQAQLGSRSAGMIHGRFHLCISSVSRFVLGRKVIFSG